jgi:uncharacterized phage protein (TIGR02216 family)
MDWRGLMQAGIGGLRLSPAAFWALTPVELQVMLGLTGSAAPMLRARLDDLLAAFPDEDVKDG